MTTIRVKSDTLDQLKTYYEEPYNFTSLDQVIEFLLHKEYLFEVVVQKVPDLRNKISGIVKEIQIERLEARVKRLKEGHDSMPPYYGLFVKPCILNVNMNP